MASLPTAAKAMLDAHRALRQALDAGIGLSIETALDAADDAAKALADALLAEAYGNQTCRNCRHPYNEHTRCGHDDTLTCCDCAYFDEGPNG